MAVKRSVLRPIPIHSQNPTHEGSEPVEGIEAEYRTAEWIYLRAELRSGQLLLTLDIQEARDLLQALTAVLALHRGE